MSIKEIEIEDLLAQAMVLETSAAALCPVLWAAFIVTFLTLFVTSTSALAIASDSSVWRTLPHVDRRDVLKVAGAGAAATSAASALASPSIASATSSQFLSGSHRSVASIDSYPIIPVWPSWAGGRVVPVFLGDSPLTDPFLLLAHHKHWFDPKDILREPFKAAGKVLGLPYVDVEGFSMHPHRGFDILTYVLDGSDGFRHRDSLGGERTYRGGTAQWMRTGSGVLHEEFWETRPDHRTNIELFQLWINLPASRKFDKPEVEYVGLNTEKPWTEKTLSNPYDKGNIFAHVRNIGSTLDRMTAATDSVEQRPAVGIVHSKILPNGQWTAQVPAGHSALVYVREGTATLPGTLVAGKPAEVQALQSATFPPDGDSIAISNVSGRRSLDLLLLTAEPLREPVVMSGPIVMNTDREINDAYRQLRDGTFLDRDTVMRQHQRL